MLRLGMPAVLATLLGLASTAWAFDVSSPAVGGDGVIPQRNTADDYGCGGANLSLPLEWSDVPQGAQSLAVTIMDRDAGGGDGFWHWLVVNLPPSTPGLMEGAGRAGNSGLPPGAVQLRNSAGTVAYFGPCPPPNDDPHHYVVTVYALKVARLDLSPDAGAAAVEARLQAALLAKARIVYTYGR